MGGRATLILVALVAATALLVVSGEGIKRQPGAELEIRQAAPAAAPIPGRRVFDVARDAITAITIVKADKRIEVFRQQGGWGQETTTRVVDGLLDDVLGLRTLDEIPVTTQDLADYGLQPPQATLEISQSNGQPILLSIGKHNPSATAVYVYFAGKGPVYLVGSLLAWKVDGVARDLPAQLAAPSG